MSTALVPVTREVSPAKYNELLMEHKNTLDRFKGFKAEVVGSELPNTAFHAGLDFTGQMEAGLARGYFGKKADVPVLMLSAAEIAAGVALGSPAAITHGMSRLSYVIARRTEDRTAAWVADGGTISGLFSGSEDDKKPKIEEVKADNTERQGGRKAAS